MAGTVTDIRSLDRRQALDALTLELSRASFRFMFFVRMLREIFNLLFGLAGLYLTFAFGAEPWVGALSLGLALWALYEIRKELLDRSQESPVAQVQAEQEAIRARLEAKSSERP